MTTNELITIVKKINDSKPFTLDKVVLSLNSLRPQDHELLSLIVNYKNSNDFEKKLKKGEI